MSRVLDYLLRRPVRLLNPPHMHTDDVAEAAQKMAGMLEAHADNTIHTAQQLKEITDLLKDTVGGKQ